MAYDNPYKELETIYNAKVGWDKAQTEEERKRLNQSAEQARQRLKDYGYETLADRTSANGATASDVKKILDSYAPNVDTSTGNLKTGVIGSPAFDTTINNAINKSNKRDNLIYSDKKDMQKEYEDILNYANQDITETDEYKSTFKNVMPYYNYQAMMGRDNELANGAASNGGNIDSYAAANAARQQAALTSKGQMLAHQMGLDAYNSRVSNVGKILSDLGVYNSGVYDALQQGVENQVGFATTINSALNDQTDRLVKQSATTGYIPKEWQYSNNPYFNTDGTLKPVYTSDAFDNEGGFTTIINNATEQLKTETDPVKRANLEATINYAQQAKAYKTGAFEKYAKWASEVMGTTPEENAEMKQARISDATARKALDVDADVSKYNADKSAEAAMYNADKEYDATVAGYQNSLDQINAQAEANKDLMLTEKELEEKVEAYPISSIDMTKITANNIDEYGQRALMGLIDLANKTENKGILTKEQIIEYLVSNSALDDKGNGNGTNKDQLTKVSKYLGLGVDWLENIEDVNLSNWQQGVKWKIE